jgi:phosphoribosylformylglycinamidine cyclo-ligase
LPREGLTYSGAGVDITAGERAVDAMKELVKSTHRPEVLGEVGGFGGLFAVPQTYRSPVLVASTDGVGTKLAVARAMGRYTTVGIDLVAMCVDDLVCQGAEPLFLLDYQVHGSLSVPVVGQVMQGIAQGCREAGCAILGGELAEHPGSLDDGDFDLVGFAVGVVERDEVLGPSRVRVGDLLVGLASPGLRSNGYSLARQAFEGRPLDAPAWPGASITLGEELLRPSIIYTPAVVSLLHDAEGVEVHAVAHITGGGLPGNLPRVLGAGQRAVLRRGSWKTPPVFAEVQRAGGIRDEEMARVFNLGLGMVIVAPQQSASAALDWLAGQGLDAGIVGEVAAGEPGVSLV